MEKPNIIIYGADWCGDCKRARRILNQSQVSYEWIDIDKDKEAEQYVIKTNRGFRSIPTILFPDGTILVEPSNSALTQKLKVLNA
jgi:glutaredoxin-like protein